MRHGLWEDKYRTTTVWIDSFEDEILKGRLYNPMLNEEVHFESTIQFLLQMEQLMSEIGSPQSCTSTRKFIFPCANEITAINFVSVREKQKPIATFQLRVLFRQHSSWQGILYWAEKKQEEHFRSVLELLLLMNSVLTEGGNELKKSS